jgi:hypothetical protein
METKFKKHQIVKLTASPDKEYVEYNFSEIDEEVPIKPGMKAKINMILPNGQYHVEILDKKDKVIAYVMINEEALEEI